MVTIQELIAVGVLRATRKQTGNSIATVISPIRGVEVEFAYHGKHRRGLIDNVDVGCKTLTVAFVDASGDNFYRQFNFEKIHNFRVLAACPS